MKPVRLVIAALSLACAGMSTVRAQEPEPAYPDPGTFAIDWQRQVIVTNSIGAPNTNFPQPTWRASAITAAKNAAFRDLLEALKGVAVSSTTTVENMMVSSDVIRSEVEGLLRDFVTIDVKYYESMDVSMIVEVPLTGALTEALLGEDLAERPESPEPGRARTTTGSRAVTGLVVDASGLDVTPAMAPKIVDEAGQEVYGTADVSRQFAIKEGVVGYHNNVEAAVQNERVAGNPLVVRGIRVSGPNNCDVVISTADANRIREMAGNQAFLAECRVMIVVGN